MTDRKIKIGSVEMTVAQAQELHDTGKIIAAYRTMYRVILKNDGTPTGKKIAYLPKRDPQAVPLTPRGRCTAITHDTALDWIKKYECVTF